MNYLAHAYLSFNNNDILIGNMISDYVKGKQQFLYNNQIQKGIQLHRKIDRFTDTHLAVKDAIKLFKQEVGLYAGAFVDIIFDYFLANDKTKFINEDALLEFTLDTYKIIQKNIQLLPIKFVEMFSYMQTQNWLFNYRHQQGIGLSFKGITKRAKYLNKEHQAFLIFKENEKCLRDNYLNFICDLVDYSKSVIHLNDFN